MRFRVPNNCTLQHRFDIGFIPEPNSGCWLWMRGIEGSGYPTIKFKGRTLHGNRVSWELHRGTIPDGMCVLHSCDVRSCVNPDHLYLGTKKDNAIDMVAKGRANRPFGERHHASKLALSDITAIRSSSISAGSLAKQYGVAKSTIGNIRNGKTWHHKGTRQ